MIIGGACSPIVAAGEVKKTRGSAKSGQGRVKPPWECARDALRGSFQLRAAKGGSAGVSPRNPVQQFSSHKLCFLFSRYVVS